MICTDCKDRRHGECRGGSWCDCQDPQHGAVLNSQQRNDLAAYGTTDAPRLCPTCPLTAAPPVSDGRVG